MYRVVLDNVWKSFGNVEAVRGVSLEIRKGELFTILGPSGCGKTTLLKIISGLLEPDSGRIFFDDRDVTHIPPHKRGVGVVFQDLALFPHMTVYDNIAYGLRLRGLGEEEIRRRVYEVLRMVRLDPKIFSERRVTSLSGGQQQRVAIARTLVLEPGVLLLDEPFSHLDYKIRQDLMAEFRRLQRRIGITTIYVTHDQTEAMLLSDRIAIMNDGKIIQVGRPLEVYEEPATLFVARFFGDTNIIKINGKLIAVRYEDVQLSPKPPSGEAFRGVVEDKVFMGATIRFEVNIGGTIVRALYPRRSAPSIGKGEEVWVWWEKSRERVFTP